MTESIYKFPAVEIIVLPQGNLDQFNDWFSQDEIFFAENTFAILERRHTWLSARRALKKLLQRQYSISPLSYSVSRDELGRPYIFPAILINGKNIDVSISHSENLVMAGISLAGDIGIDIELQSRVINTNSWLKVLHLAELTALDDLKDTPEDLRHKLLWCFKESYLKASRGKDFMEMKKSHLRVIEKDGRFSVEALQPLPVAIIDSGAVVSEAYVATWVVCGRNRI